MEYFIFVGLIVLGYLIAYVIGWRFGKTENIFLLVLVISMTCIGWPTIGSNYELICNVLLGSSEIPTWNFILLPILFVISVIAGFYCGYSNSLKHHNEIETQYHKHGME